MVKKTVLVCDECGTTVQLIYTCVVCKKDICRKCAQKIGKLWMCKKHLTETLISPRELNKIFNQNYGFSYLEPGDWEKFKAYNHQDWLVIDLSDDGEPSIHLESSLQNAIGTLESLSYHKGDSTIFGYHDGNFYDPQATYQMIKK